MVSMSYADFAYAYMMKLVYNYCLKYTFRIYFQSYTNYMHIPSFIEASSWVLSFGILFGAVMYTVEQIIPQNNLKLHWRRQQ